MMFWLSFADGNLPEGSQFLGVAIIRALYPAEAIRAAHMLGCNPGGEVQFVGIPDDLARLVPEDMIGVLLSRKQAEKFDDIFTGE